MTILIKSLRSSTFYCVLIIALLFGSLLVFTGGSSGSDSGKKIVPKSVFSNTSPITVNTVATPTPNPLLIPAAAYPSNINVSGLTGTTTKVTVSLRGFTHKRPFALDLLVVSPTGQKFIILSDSGNGNYPANDVDVTFDDDAPTQYPASGEIYSGPYRPRNIGTGDIFPAPAPPAPYNSSLDSTLGATFNGADPNGSWSLYIVNQTGFSEQGALNLGWSLNVTTMGSAATTFANSAYLEISWLKAKATPYGSVINVSGVSGVISNLKVSLSGITHGRSQDIDVLLVSPNGTAMIIMADTGNGSASNVDLTFDDAAPQSIPSSTLVSGTYRTTNTNDSNPVSDLDVFLGPAPLEPYFNFNQLAKFNGINPNGNWALYVVDDGPGQSGQIAGGWSLDVTTQPYVPVQIGCNIPTLSLSNSFGVGIGPTHLAVGNFDGGNGPDLVVTNQVSNTVSVLLNNGSGGFANQTLLTAGSSPYDVAVGNFNGDLNQDLAVINSGSNNVSIFLGNGNGTFSTATNFVAGASPISIAAADFNNDTNLDLAIANFGGFFSGTVSVLFGNGSGGFSLPITLRTRTQPSFVAVGNFNTADSRPDLAVATFGSDSVAVFLNNGNSTFSLASNVTVGAGPVFIEVVDLNGDSKDDLQVANYNSDTITQRFGNGDGSFSGGGSTSIGLNPTAIVSGDFTLNGNNLQTAVSLSGANTVKFLQQSQVGTGTFPYSLVKGDFDGDGKLDLATSNSDSNDISILLNSCQVAKGNLFDFNGDRRTDYSVYRADRSSWYSASFSTPKNFGKPTDTLVPADYNGDGVTDYAVYRPENGLWIGQNSSNNPLFFQQFGLAGDIPVPADFDGDSKVDIAVWRPSNGTWYIRRSTDNALQISQFGATDDRPVAADYDGDGSADLGIFRASTGVWYILRSGDGGATILQFGIGTDRALPADYDGDGKADIAVWRPSTGVWYVVRSSDGGFTIVQYGMPGDIPAEGDFEGDGKFDLSVYRPTQGIWYILRSSDNISQAFNYGISTDVPIPSAFVR